MKKVIDWLFYVSFVVFILFVIFSNDVLIVVKAGIGALLVFNCKD